MNIKFLGSMLLLLITATCFAQDTIYLRNDQRIPCTIVEVGTTQVKYKRLEISEGPLYIENKSAIARIKYNNGFIDVFPEPVKNTEEDYVREPKSPKGRNDDYIKPPEKDKLIMINNNIYIHGDKQLNERKMHDLLLAVNNPQITREIKRAKLDKNLKYIGFLAIPLAIGGIVCASLIDDPYGPYPSSSNKEFIAPSVICAVGAAAAFSASIYFGIDRKARNIKAVRLYQEKYQGNK